MPGISDIFFNGIKNVSDTSSDKQSVDGSAKLAAMKNGDTFQAKVVQSGGSDVVLRLPSGETLNAKLSSNMALTEGQSVSFEVKNSGSTVTISPLLTNTSADVNVLKALDYAQIPVDDKTTSMTLEMMKAGLPIDRSSLLSMYENVRNYPESDITNIVDLSKLGIEVNESNLQNIESYKNLSYQIDQGMQTLSELTDKALLDMVKGGDGEGSFELMNSLTRMAADYASSDNAFASSPINADIKEVIGSLSSPVTEKADGVPVQDNANAGQAAEQIQQESPGTAQVSDPAAKALELLKAMQNTSPADDKTASSVNDSGQGTAKNEAVVLSGSGSSDIPVKDLPVSSQNASNISNTVSNVPESLIHESVNIKEDVSETISLLRDINNSPDYKPADMGTLLKDLSSALQKAYQNGDHTTLNRIISNDQARSLVFNVLKDGWKVSPSDVADKEKVESLYKRLNDQLSGIKEALANAGQSGSEAFKAAENMKSNVDFLNQINQMYAYIQLPLKLSGGDNAHGDLYVYSNKKNMTSDDSNVTAFLHLDMDNLGPVDVYVSMDLKAGGKVSTNFTVADDDTLDLLNAHMDQLTDRLKKRGYDITCSMKKRGDENDSEEDALDKGGVNFLLMHSGLSSASFSAGMRSFDVRA